MKLSQILLSTFNGERFLQDLLDSLMCQDYQPVKILVRDDGSRDRTLSVLEEYATRYRSIEVHRGKNLGAARSFFKLLEMSSQEAEYFAFCDQDDVWLKNKVSRAIAHLSELDPTVPGMYCSRLLVTDEGLKVIARSPFPERGSSFENALVENIATGCTMVLNRAAKDLLLYKRPSFLFMHDWWTYLVVSALGKVCYDRRATVLYRQHSSNVLGVKNGKASARIRRFLRGNTKRFFSQQAEEFQNLYEHLLSEERRLVLDRFIDSRRTLKSRLFYAVTSDVHRQSFIDEILLRLLIAMNRI